MNRIATLLFLVVGFLLLGNTSSAQTPVAPAPQPVTQTWSATLNAVALPGGKTSLAGTDAGIAFTPSPNLDLCERNIITSDRSAMFNGGCFRYRLPALSLAANNASQNVNFLRVQFYATGSFGMAQINGVNHYGYLAGGGLNYQMTKGGAWTFGASGEYVHFPGYPVKAAIELGTAIHF